MIRGNDPTMTLAGDCSINSANNVVQVETRKKTSQKKKDCGNIGYIGNIYSCT